MITIIAALTKSGVIGSDNALPWYIPEDLKNFKKITTGNTIIMGRKTFESIGKPLPNRNNIVISSSVRSYDGVILCNTIDKALECAHALKKSIFVIGGAHIYKQFLPYANRLLLSHIKKEYQGTIYFPQFDMNEWNIEQSHNFEDFELVEYTRKK